MATRGSVPPVLATPSPGGEAPGAGDSAPARQGAQGGGVPQAARDRPPDAVPRRGGAAGGGGGCGRGSEVGRLCSDGVGGYDALLARVVDQTRRRVLGGETVPAAEKIVSLFEPHTDIIVKGGRGTHYGHKVNLATGRSGMALDVVVEDGNPADSSRCLPMLERHVAHYGAVPTHAAFDGGYASRRNLDEAKALGVKHAVFHRKRDMKPEDMTPSSWVHAQLRRFRAGIEAGISYLKRCFGLGRCRWRPGALQGLRAIGRGRAQPDPHGAAGAVPRLRRRLRPSPPPGRGRPAVRRVRSRRSRPRRPSRTSHGPGSRRPRASEVGGTG